jgi:hypothetical protein
MQGVVTTQRLGGVWKVLLTAAALAALAVPAGAGEIYSWRTEDGSYAYTDDPKAIPPRYREQATARASRSLAGYGRYTPQDDGATAVYAERLRERVERLRELNHELARRESGRAARGAGAQAPEYVTLRTGRRERGVDLTLPATRAQGQQPLTVETVFVRLEGSNVIQRVQVTKRGDEVIAITKPRPRNWNVNETVDEAELLEELER